MVKAYKDKVIIELPGEGYEQNDAGFYVPGNEVRREMMKKIGRRELVPGEYNLHIRDGVVTSTGNAVREVKEQDYVMYNKHDGDEFEYDGKRYITMEERWILAIYRNAHVVH